MPGAWKRHREKLRQLVLRHPAIFGPYSREKTDFDSMGPGLRKGDETDNWGCIWHNVDEGIVGQVIGHPIADWNALTSYKLPDVVLYDEWGPPRDWSWIRANAERSRKNGLLVWGGGCTIRLFERLHFLRGFKNLMLDFARNPPELQKLIDMITESNMRLTRKWLELDLDVMSYGDDLGNQTKSMISPATFRKYLKPSYLRLFSACREAGTHVYFHSDGHILELVDDLVEAGVTIINIQSRPNTIDGIVRKCKGKVCISLDLDRQLFPIGSPERIKEHIREAVRMLNSEQGGLMMEASVSADVPLENIEAICQIFEEYMPDEPLPHDENLGFW